MKIYNKISVLVLMFLLAACSNHIGLYQSHGMQSIELKDDNNVKIIRHLCISEQGKYFNLSRKKIIITSFFHKDSLPVVVTQNDSGLNRLLFHNLPYCFYWNNKNIILDNNCFFEKGYVIMGDIRMNIKDSIMVFDISKINDSNIAVVLNTTSPYKCSNESYSFNIKLNEHPSDYHINWEMDYFSSISLNDTFTIKKNKLIWNTQNITFQKFNISNSPDLSQE